MISVTHITTESGAIYLKKLCHYFARTVPATYAGTKARIQFPSGPCHIDIDQKQMKLTIEMSNPDELAQTEILLADQLVRITQGKVPTIRWVRSQQP